MMQIWFDIKIGKKRTDDNGKIHERVEASRLCQSFIGSNFRDFEKDITQMFKFALRDLIETYEFNQKYGVEIKHARSHNKTRRNIRRESDKVSNHSGKVE